MSNMSVREAMSLLGFTSVDELSQESIKVKWKNIIKKIHPDIGGDEELTKKCNMAYEVLMNALPNIDYLHKVEKNVIKLIGIKDLVAIYEERARSSKLGMNFGDIVDRKKKKERLLIEIPVAIKFRDLIVEKSFLMLQSKNDIYTCTIFLDDHGDIFKEEDIEVIVIDKAVHNVMGCKKVFKFDFGYNVTVLVHVERVEAT